MYHWHFQSTFVYLKIPKKSSKNQENLTKIEKMRGISEGKIQEKN